jgi:hypothetical protein
VRPERPALRLIEPFGDEAALDLRLEHDQLRRLDRQREQPRPTPSGPGDRVAEEDGGSREIDSADQLLQTLALILWPIAEECEGDVQRNGRDGA